MTSHNTPGLVQDGFAAAGDVQGLDAGIGKQVHGGGNGPVDALRPG